ncbi:MAG: hypothetical protein ABGY75_23220 [Gemmataceae bacterium]
MTRTELHDQTVDRLYEAIRFAPSLRPNYHALKGVTWATHSDFPQYEYLFDIVLVHGAPRFTLENGTTRLAGRNRVTTVIDVIDDGCETEFYDKPDALWFSSTCEYVLFDPSGELMRPSLHVVRKRDDWFQPARSAKDGVFFSTCGFRLDVRGPEFSISPSGRPRVEEELLKCRKTFEKHPNPALTVKIRELEEEARKPMREPDE